MQSIDQRSTLHESEENFLEEENNESEENFLEEENNGDGDGEKEQIIFINISPDELNFNQEGLAVSKIH